MSKKLTSDHFQGKKPSKLKLISPTCSIHVPPLSDLRLAQKILHHKDLKKRSYMMMFSDYKGDEVYSTKNSKMFSRVLRQSKLIQKLHIHHAYGMSDLKLEPLSQCLRELVHLKSLSLKMSPEVYETTNNGLSKLSEGLQKLSSLESLCLCFDNCSYTNNKSLEILSQGFRKQITLKKIELYFANCHQITNLGIWKLRKGLKNLTFLRSFDLGFYKCDLITDRGLIGLAKLIKKLKYLETVNFFSDKCAKISLHGVEYLTQAFKSLISLRRVHIQILGYSYTMKIEQNDQGLRTVTLLQKISVDFWENNSKIKFNSLRGFLNEQKLNSSLEYSYETNDCQLKHFCQDLRALKSLESIHLTCFYITDQELENLAESFQNHASLKHASFKFRECTKITDLGLLHLSKGLEELSSLQSMHLKFSVCSEMTNKGLCDLSQGFRNMVSLQKISLIFSPGTFQIDNSGVEALAQGMEKLVSLQEVTLLFQHSLKTAESGRDKIIEALKNKNSLRNVSIDFVKSPQVIGIENERSYEGQKKEKVRSGFLCRGGVRFFNKVKSFFIKK